MLAFGAFSKNDLHSTVWYEQGHIHEEGPAARKLVRSGWRSFHDTRWALAWKDSGSLVETEYEQVKRYFIPLSGSWLLV